jgi:hypothetical protein
MSRLKWLRGNDAVLVSACLPTESVFVKYSQSSLRELFPYTICLCALHPGCHSADGHGACVCGDCQCIVPMTGPDCGCNSTLTCPVTQGVECSGHGSCECGECGCDPGWGHVPGAVTNDCSCSLKPCDGCENGLCKCGQCQDCVEVRTRLHVACNRL